MNSATAVVTGIVVFLVALPLVRIWAWCLADVASGRADLDARSQLLWFLLLLVASLFGIAAYVLAGPGAGRWDPDMLWWPWKH